ncbi:AAA family ATPase [Haloquadratum walsbyi]|jgi:ATPases of the AAA+ class|uniref:ATPase of the AAA+ class n=1 Tax=Haloquadratum walsbyi J07HQW2 TaxID=1238425 RepID=U1PU94_9EURY|nr:AAA family ATPase [Haloquadratum walsbyi]ERG95936.1 MAG: ATPase of the AAA+ class [Haloquadratum walsbyi J07HQW2]
MKRVAATVTIDSELPPDTVRLRWPLIDSTARARDTADSTVDDSTSPLDSDVVRLRTNNGRMTAAVVRPDSTVSPETIIVSSNLAAALDISSDTNGAVDSDQNSQTDHVVTVEPTTVSPAYQLTVAPVAELSISGGERTVRQALDTRPLVCGDTIPTVFLDGSLELPVRITKTRPDGPVAITEKTELQLDSGPASNATPPQQVPIPPAGIGGYDDIIEACRRTIADPLIHADTYHVDDRSAASGVLIEGQSGVGKTHLIRHSAWYADATIRTIDCTALASESPSNITDELASHTAAITTGNSTSTIVLIDNLEIIGEDDDAIARQIGAWIEKTLQLDSATVVAECTDADAIDPVFTRGGRLSRIISVTAPTPEDRAAIISILFNDTPIVSRIDYTAVAEQTLGYVAADIINLRARAIEAALARYDTEDNKQTEFRILPPDIEIAITETTPSAAETTGSVPSTTFEDIGGLAAPKRELTRAVEWPLQYPEALSRLGVDAPAGILLYGPPGTGKTMLARAVASTTDANFLTVDGPELLNKYVGESERRVRQLFTRARDSSPAVVFFDEVDALGSARAGDGASATERVVSQLLTELDGLHPREQVTVIGATNRPDRIDDALTRPGRFDRVVEVPLPGPEARQEIIRIHTRDRPTEPLDIDEIAKKTDGYSGSDISAVLQEASLLALEEHLGAAESDAAEDTKSIQTTPPDATPAGVESLEAVRIHRRHVDAALDRIGPSLSATARERYASFNDTQS